MTQATNFKSYLTRALYRSYARAERNIEKRWERSELKKLEDADNEYCVEMQIPYSLGRDTLYGR